MKTQKKIPKGFGERMKSLRKAKGITLHQLAKESEVTRGQLINYESEKQMPGGAALISIAQALETSTDFILGIISKGDLEEEVLIAANRVNGYPMEYKKLVLKNLEIMDTAFTVYKLKERDIN